MICHRKEYPYKFKDEIDTDVECICDVCGYCEFMKTLNEAHYY